MTEYSNFTDVKITINQSYQSKNNSSNLDNFLNIFKFHCDYKLNFENNDTTIVKSITIAVVFESFFNIKKVQVEDYKRINKWTAYFSYKT